MIDPEVPRLSDGSLSFCGNDTRTVFVPELFNNAEDCFFHHEWEWTAPPGWSINGGGRTLIIREDRISLRAPSNVQSGNLGNYELFIESVGHPLRERENERKIWIGKAAFLTGNLTGPSTIYTGNSGLYSAPKAEGVASYQWVFPNGGFRIVSGHGARQARLEPTGSTGLKMIELRAHNACGYNKKYIYVNVKSSSGGGGGGSDPCATSLALAPNPTSGNLAALVLPPGGGDDPCDELAFSLTTDNLPSMNQATFEKEEKEGQIIVVSYLGEEVYNKKHKGEKLNLHLNKLDPGIYTIYYYYNSELLTSKFIKK